MALDKLTIIDGGGLSTTSDYRVGVITATKFVGPIEGAITSTDATFTGNVTIGGTLTYEDVTNIDSVGLITARDGIFLADTKKAMFGNTAVDPDLEIYHGGTASYISHSGTGNLFIHSNTIAIRKQNQQAYFVGVNGTSSLYDQGNVKLNTTETGVEVTGILTATNGLDAIGIQSGGVNISTGIITAINFIGLGNTFAVNGTTVDVSISGNAGAGGTWSSYTAGIATTKSVGVNTNNLDDNDLVGVGNSFQGLYISNGMMITDNKLSGNHYIGTAFNGLMAGPVTVEGTLTIDGNYVVV